jgi:hypothetical protein
MHSSGEPGIRLSPALLDAIRKIGDFVRETTGSAPSEAEIARALKRYFVLKEIRDHILLDRGGCVGASAEGKEAPT